MELRVCTSDMFGDKIQVGGSLGGRDAGEVVTVLGTPLICIKQILL